jgi:hypothetical protein
VVKTEPDETLLESFCFEFLYLPFQEDKHTFGSQLCNCKSLKSVKIKKRTTAKQTINLITEVTLPSAVV